MLFVVIVPVIVVATMNTVFFHPKITLNRCVTGGFYTLSGLSSHRKETCGRRVRCIPATASGAGSRVTGTVLKYPTRGLPVMNPIYSTGMILLTDQNNFWGHVLYWISSPHSLVLMLTKHFPHIQTNEDSPIFGSCHCQLTMCVHNRFF